MRSKQGLTLMERFVVECLLTLGHCRAEELWEIASIPHELSHWLLSSLTQKELAQQDGHWFSPNKDACILALAEKCVQVEHEDRRAFIWFPETHELVVIPDAGDLLRELRHIYPVSTFPLSVDWANANRGEIIRDAMKRKRLHGDDAGVILEVNDAEPFDTQSCCAYQCRAVLPRRGIDGWRLAITGFRKRKRRSQASEDNANARGDEQIEQTLPVPVLPELARAWRDRFEFAAQTIKIQLEQRFGGADVTIDDRQLIAIVTEATARTVSRERLLVARIGLEVRIDREIQYIVPLQLQAHHSDYAAQKLFALDGVVQRILAATRDSHAAQIACAEQSISLSEILDRLWTLKLFRTVYDLREAEDFSG